IQRLGRAKLEVTARERPGFSCQGAIEVRGERADRDQRGDAEGDAAEEHREVARGAASLAPGHAEGECEAHDAPLRIRPSCSRTTRSACPASASSWVTSTRVDPRRRFSASSSSMICTPVAESRLPVGSSASKRSEEHTSELQSRGHLVCRLLLEKKQEDDI